jgi:hypothetical protein
MQIFVVHAPPSSGGATPASGRLKGGNRAKLDLAVLLAEARADLGLTYATSDLLRVAAHNLLGARLPDDSDNPHALFCSQYVERCFRKAGVALCHDSDVGTSPSEIAGSDVLEFMGSILHDPNIVPDRSADSVAVARAKMG